MKLDKKDVLLYAVTDFHDLKGKTLSQSVEEAILALDKVTRILITHRLNENTLKSVDNIIVIKNGRVVEEGKFSELIERKGYFYSLYNLTNE